MCPDGIEGFAHAGVNASDVNYSSGRYFGSPEESAKLLPFDAGFEAVGVVAAVGPNVTGECHKTTGAVGTLSGHKNPD